MAVIRSCWRTQTAHLQSTRSFEAVMGTDKESKQVHTCICCWKYAENPRIKGAFHRHHAAFGKCSGCVLVYSCVSAPAESHSCDLSRSPNKFLGDQLNILIWRLEIMNFLKLCCICPVAGWVLLLFSAHELKLYLGILTSNSIHKTFLWNYSWIWLSSLPEYADCRSEIQNT